MHQKNDKFLLDIILMDLHPYPDKINMFSVTSMLDETTKLITNISNN